MMNMNSNFEKELAELVELANKGGDADPKKFERLANDLLWEFNTYFCLPLKPEHLAFIKILTNSDAGGDYWKGFGRALTMFLVPLNRNYLPNLPTPPEQPEPVSEPKQFTPVKPKGSNSAGEGFAQKDPEEIKFITD
jgi:hypothetical protein